MALGRNTDARRGYEWAYGAAVTQSDRSLQASCLRHWGQACTGQNDYAEAEQHLTKSLQICQDLVDKRGMANAQLEQASVHCALGQVYDRWGRYDQALDELEQGLELVGAQAHVTRAQLLRMRCSVLISRGRLEEAERNGLEALQVARNIGARMEEAYVCNNLGAVYGTQGQGEQALAFHQQSLELRRALGAMREVAQSLGNVGTAFMLLKRYGEAEDCFREAIEVSDRIGDRRTQGSIHHNLAWTYVHRDQLNLAEPEFRRALSLWEPIKHRRGIAFAHNDLGALYLQQGRLHEARDYLEESARRYEEMGANAYLSDNYVALARVYLQLDHPQNALSAAQKALGAAQDRTRQVAAHLMLGEVLWTDGESAVARRHAELALNEAQQEPPLPQQIKAAIKLLDSIDQI